MPRIRSIKPEFFTDADLCELSPLHRILFAGLWCQQDKSGVCLDRPRELKVKVLPFDSCDVDAMLWDLTDGGFIARYQHDGERYIQTLAFELHQHPHQNEKPSKFPVASCAGSVPVLIRAQDRPNTPDHCLLSLGSGLLAPVSGEPQAGQKRPQPPPHHVPTTPVGGLRDLLEAEFLEQRRAKYPWRSADDNAVRELLSLADYDESLIVRTWRSALQHKSWPRCDTTTDLAKFWPRYVSLANHMEGDRARV